ncbi:alcohol dehydrogenase catalytic domain-containing protein [Bordetella genomosp. 4]|uniref:alcohol dehydrogenase catalytic domain-containing protein n=1 Tax=Bordetella genomosp. 4 TaxID=463044 RepID=UPI003F83A35B
MPRIVRFYEHGGPEVLRIETVDVPPPGPGEVQIRVKALGLNRAEALLRAGSYIERPTFPSGLGLEAAGVVEAVGRMSRWLRLAKPSASCRRNRWFAGLRMAS